VRSFPSLFTVVGRHPNQKIFSNRVHAANATHAQQQRAAPSAATEKKGGANAPSQQYNDTGSTQPLVSKAAMEAAKRAEKAGKSGATATAANGHTGAQPLLSKAAMEAAARAATGLKKAGDKISLQAIAVEVQDQISELRSDLSVAMAALTSAQQRMERLEAAMRSDEAALTSSAA